LEGKAKRAARAAIGREHARARERSNLAGGETEKVGDVCGAIRFHREQRVGAGGKAALAGQ
jgi:hypothetical protein